MSNFRKKIEKIKTLLQERISNDKDISNLLDELIPLQDDIDRLDRIMKGETFENQPYEFRDKLINLRKNQSDRWMAIHNKIFDKAPEIAHMLSDG